MFPVKLKHAKKGSDIGKLWRMDGSKARFVFWRENERGRQSDFGLKNRPKSHPFKKMFGQLLSRKHLSKISRPETPKYNATVRI